MLNLYNTIYRNFPGWVVNTDDTVDKSQKAEERKRPLVKKVEEKDDCQKERQAEDQYDKAGSEMRNELRSVFYDKHGKRVSI